MATIAAAERRSAGALERLWWRRGALLQRLAMWLVLAIFLLPVVWAVSASLKTRVELYQALPSLLPLHPTLANYWFAIERMPTFVQQFQNSLIVAIGATIVLTLALGPLEGIERRFVPRDSAFWRFTVTMPEGADPLSLPIWQAHRLRPVRRSLRSTPEGLRVVIEVSAHRDADPHVVSADLRLHGASRVDWEAVGQIGLE